jgi:hypothetical protein
VQLIQLESPLLEEVVAVSPGLAELLLMLLVVQAYLHHVPSYS